MANESKLNLKELIEKYGEMKREANKLYAQYKDMQEPLSELRGLLQAELESVGLKSAKSAKFGVYIAPSTDVVVTNEHAVMEWLKESPDVEEDFYIGLKVTKFKGLAHQILKETGEVVDGTEVVHKESLTIKENKK